MQYRTLIIEMPETNADFQKAVRAAADAMPQGYQLLSVAADLGTYGHRLLMVFVKPAAE